MAKAHYQQFLLNFTNPDRVAGHGDICSLFLACISVDEACHITMDWFKQQFPEISGDIALFSENHEFLETMVSWNDKRSQGDSFRSADCWAIRRGRPHHFGADCGTGIAPCQHYDTDGDDWHLCLPLMASGEVLGLMHFHGPSVPVDNDTAGPSEDAQLGSNLHDISESLSMSIVSLKLRKTLQNQAIRDPLTQLFNRRYLEYTMQREIHQAERAKTPLTLAILDVDHFKQFNDGHGHDAGDALLQSIGAILLKHMRGGDIACRFGGEEFALVYPGMTEDVAFARLESIRNEIGNHSLSHRGKACAPVTISAGIAVYPDCGPDIETLINVADQALYKSKESGRNRVTIAHAEEEEEEGDEIVSLKLVHDNDTACPRRDKAEGGGAIKGPTETLQKA